MTLCYDSRVTERHDIKNMIKQLPQVKRRDGGAAAIQSFFTSEEKEAVKVFCETMGWDVSHFIRCLTLQYLSDGQEQQDKSA